MYGMAITRRKRKAPEPPAEPVELSTPAPELAAPIEGEPVAPETPVEATPIVEGVDSEWA